MNIDKNILLEIPVNPNIILKRFVPQVKRVEIEDRKIEIGVSYDFWLSDFITIQQWNYIFGINTDSALLGYKKVSWNDAMKFCNALNLKYLNKIPLNYYFSLPTEIQWEIAYHQKNIQIENVYSEWCYDDYCYIPNSVSDWIGIELSGVKSIRGVNNKGDDIFEKSYINIEDDRSNFRICLRHVNKNYLKSPRVIKSEWGKIKVEGFLNYFKDVKCFPGGSREWDWKETGTKHEPGIQITDILELLNNGSEIIILSRGHHERLKIHHEVVSYLEKENIKYHILDTQQAVEIYNTYVNTGKLIGALFHSTC